MSSNCVVSQTGGRNDKIVNLRTCHCLSTWAVNSSNRKIPNNTNDAQKYSQQIRPTNRVSQFGSYGCKFLHEKVQFSIQCTVQQKCSLAYDERNKKQNCCTRSLRTDFYETFTTYALLSISSISSHHNVIVTSSGYVIIFICFRFSPFLVSHCLSTILTLNPYLIFFLSNLLSLTYPVLS